MSQNSLTLNTYTKIVNNDSDLPNAQFINSLSICLRGGALTLNYRLSTYAEKTAMDYYHYYQNFVRELQSNPDLKLQTYCESQDIMFRRLYDWMRRNHISLRQLYKTYGRQQADMYGVPALKEQPEFSELKVLHKTASVHGESVVESVRLTLPSGVIVDMSCCPSSVLSMLVVRCMGKEAGDVCP